MSLEDRPLEEAGAAPAAEQPPAVALSAPSEAAAVRRAPARVTSSNEPKGRGVKLTVALTSHLELPSGRDPGLALRAFGMTPPE